jgi:hypothetical protein
MGDEVRGETVKAHDVYGHDVGRPRRSERAHDAGEVPIGAIAAVAGKTVRLPIRQRPCAPSTWSSRASPTPTSRRARVACGSLSTPSLANPPDNSHARSASGVTSWRMACCQARPARSIPTSSCSAASASTDSPCMRGSNGHRSWGSYARSGQRSAGSRTICDPRSVRPSRSTIMSRPSPWRARQRARARCCSSTAESPAA